MFHFSLCRVPGDAPPPLWIHATACAGPTDTASAIWAGRTGRSVGEQPFPGCDPRVRNVRGRRIADMPVEAHLRRTTGSSAAKLFRLGSRSCSTIPAASASCCIPPRGRGETPGRSPPVIGTLRPFRRAARRRAGVGRGARGQASPPATASSRSTGTPGTATSADSCSTPTRWTVRCAGSGRPPGSMLS